MSLVGPRPDASQVLQNIYDPINNGIQVTVPSTAGIPIKNVPGQSLNVATINSLVPVAYDSIALTYWTSGNGNGQIETAQYYTGGLSGTLVATLTVQYNASAQISSVVKT